MTAPRIRVSEITPGKHGAPLGLAEDSREAWVKVIGYLDEPTIGCTSSEIHAAVKAGASTVNLLGHCLGGSSTAAVALGALLMALQGVRTVAWNIGTWGSAGIPAFLGASERYAVPHASFLFHGALVSPDHLRGDSKWLTEVHLRSELDRLVCSNAQIASIYRQRCPGLQTDDEITPLMGLPVNRSPQWCLERGVIHGIRSPIMPAPFWRAVVKGAAGIATTDLGNKGAK